MTVGPTGPGCIAPGERGQVAEVVPVDLEAHVLVLLHHLHDVTGRAEQVVSPAWDLGLQLGHPRQHEGHGVHAQP
eukprot:3556555-Pyramimonas_sp.AAC.1